MDGAERASNDAAVSIALPKIPESGFSPFRLQGQHFRQGLPVRPRVLRGARFASVLRALRFHRWIPRTVPEKRGALEHRRSSSYRCSTPRALAPSRVILSRPIITYCPHPSHLQPHLDFAAYRLIRAAPSVRFRLVLPPPVP